MPLTNEQLHEIRQIIRDHHQAFVINTMGVDAVAPDVLERLRERGLVDVKVNSVEDAYLYGQVLAAAESSKVGKMSYEQFREHVRKNPVALSDAERRAIQFAQQQAAQFVVGLGNRVDQQTGQLMIEADAKLRSETRGKIRDATAENIARRESIRKLKSKLGWATKDWARDWNRISVTEKHGSMQRGVADAIGDRHGPDARVAKRPAPDACEHCKRLYLGPDGHPRIFKLADLEANGPNNFGRRAADWLPVIGPMHPHCFPPGMLVMTHRGNVPIEDIAPGDLVLTDRGRWRPVTHIWASVYEGEVSEIKTDTAAVVATANHPFKVGSTWVPAGLLDRDDELWHFRADRVALPDLDSKDRPSVFLEGRRFASVLFGFSRRGVPVTAIHFDGEFYLREGEIDQKAIDLMTDGGSETSSAKRSVDPSFSGRFYLTRLPGDAGTDEVVGLRFSSDRVVEGCDVGSSFFWRKLAHSDALCLRTSSGHAAALSDAMGDCFSTHTELGGYFFHRQQVVEVHFEDGRWIELAPKRSGFHGSMVPVEKPIVNVTTHQYRGLVFNLTVDEDHTFVVNGFVVHNCQCQLIHVKAGWGFDEEGRLVPGGDGGVTADGPEDFERAVRAEGDLRKALRIMDRMDFQGIPIAIENTVGSVREWTDEHGNLGNTVMVHAYGYIEGTEGADGDEIDVFVGSDPRAANAFIVHQQNPANGTYDEDKVMLGFSSEAAARWAYLQNYDRPSFLVTISAMPVEHLKRWVQFTRPARGEMCKGRELTIQGTPRPPRDQPESFHIMAKARELRTVSGSLEAIGGSATSLAGHRNPGPGTVVNYLTGAKMRPKPAPASSLTPTPRELVDGMQVERHPGIRPDLEWMWAQDSMTGSLAERFQLPDRDPYGVEVTEEEIRANREDAERQGREKLAHNRNRAEVSDDDSARFRALSKADAEIMTALQRLLATGNRRATWDRLRATLEKAGRGDLYEHRIAPLQGELMRWSAEQG